MTNPIQTGVRPIRTIFVQPTLAGYRVPVYRELAARPQIELRVWHGQQDSIRNATPDGFHAELRPLRLWRLLGQEVMWHGAQIGAANDPSADVVVLSWASRYLSLGGALRAARRRGLGVVLWGHGYSRHESALRRWARDRIARYADTLLFYDRVTAESAVASGWPEDRVFVAANSIDQAPVQAAAADWTGDPTKLAAFREQQGLEGRRALLYVSRFSEKNRMPLLVDAIDALRRTHPDVVAVLVGVGETLDAVRAKVARQGLEGHFRFLGEVYDQHALAPWFLSSEAFVYPAAIGLSLLHALGYGLPVVTDDALDRHNPEIVAFQPDPARDGANGLTYASGDAASFAATLARLLDDSELRGRLAAGARQTVAGQYNVPKMVDGMVAAIARAAERRGGEPDPRAGRLNGAGGA